MRRIALAVAAGAVTAATSMLLGFTGAAAADGSCARYHAVATADGARIAVASPGFVLVEQTDVSGPAAQSAVSSDGTSSGYAGYPYPGEAALSVLPLASVPRNTYPLVAESSYPAQPDATAGGGAVALASHSRERSSNAVAQGGSDGASSAGVTKATTNVGCAEDGTIAAEAESVASGIDVGDGTVRIGRVRGFARVVVGTDGKPRPESGLDVTGMTIAGQAVGFGAGGIVVGGQSVPLPQNPVTDALEAAGISLSYVAPQPQPDGSGVTAPVLRIEVTRQVVGTGPTVVTYTFGRAFATASGSGPAQEDAVASTGDVGLGAGDSGGSGLASVAPAATTGGAAPTRSTPSRSTPPSHRVVLARSLSSGVVSGFSSESLYLVLAAAAVAVVGAGVLLRTLGVKLRWT